MVTHVKAYSKTVRGKTINVPESTRGGTPKGKGELTEAVKKLRSKAADQTLDAVAANMQADQAQQTLDSAKTQGADTAQARAALKTKQDKAAQAVKDAEKAKRVSANADITGRPPLAATTGKPRPGRPPLAAKPAKMARAIPFA